jgi:hypothetical protein
MKNKIAIASAFLAASSFSMGEIVVNDFLSFEGFVDSSYSHTDSELDLDGQSRMNANENSFQVDQVEISWLFNFDTVTAQIDLQYEGDSNEGMNEDGELVEQAFVNYALANGGVVTAGRYASMLGFEAFEPTGLYQDSFAYAIGNLGDASVLPLYAQGVKYTIEGDTTFFGISIQDQAYDLGSDRLGGNEGDSSHAVEVAGALDLGNGVSLFLGGVLEDGEDDNSHAINAYATYETGAWLFAAEVNFGDLAAGTDLSTEIASITGEAFGLNEGDVTTADEEVLQFLLMANYAYSEQASVTGRLTYSDHEGDIEGGITDTFEGDVTKLTLAHNYAFTDNLLLVTEVSHVDGDWDVGAFDPADASFGGTQVAISLLFSF